ELIIKIKNSAKQLKKYQFMGKNGRVEGTKELIISNSPYILIYRVKEESVEVLRILHTSKRYPE
ncbi:MAG: type II toxin-antitoxin system RelE/ParE family toxin, partial [Dolichospermum sp.]